MFIKYAFQETEITYRDKKIHDIEP